MRMSPTGLRAPTRLRAALAALSFGLPLLTASAAGASETITYSYDARGRLKQVSHSGSVNNGVVSSYSRDKASNRSNKTTTGAP